MTDVKKEEKVCLIAVSSVLVISLLSVIFVSRSGILDPSTYKEIESQPYIHFESLNDLALSQKTDILTTVAYAEEVESVDEPISEEVVEEEPVVEEVEESNAETEDIYETPVDYTYYEEPSVEEYVYTEPTYEQPSYSDTSNTSGFMSDGVCYDDNYRYTWYSSNALYHYRTSEWTAGDDGIYRDADGYVVVASSDYAQGTVIEDTPFGDVKVYDSGCASGTLDVYTNF